MYKTACPACGAQVEFKSAGSVMAAQPKGDIAKGKEIATNICAACHAADGNSGIAMYPKLSAQFPNYIFHQTKAIKEGKRTTGAAASMAPMVMGLSDQDIADVSAFYAKQFPKAGEANPKDNFELGARIFRGGFHCLLVDIHPGDRNAVGQ